MRKILIALVLILMLGLCGVFIFQGTTTLFTIYNMDEIAAKQIETNNEIRETSISNFQTQKTTKEESVEEKHENNVIPTEQKTKPENEGKV